ncbi:hypothetical protein ACFX1W_023369 [Malus domestica]
MRELIAIRGELEIRDSVVSKRSKPQWKNLLIRTRGKSQEYTEIHFLISNKQYKIMMNWFFFFITISRTSVVLRPSMSRDRTSLQ